MPDRAGTSQYATYTINMENPAAKRVFVQSFGCRASQADGAAIEASLADSGYEAVRDASAADLIVLNTCTVTHGADVDARRLIRGMHRDHPASEILVTGCYAQRAPEEIAAIEGVRWVVGNSHKTNISAIVVSHRISRASLCRRYCETAAVFGRAGARYSRRPDAPQSQDPRWMQ